jgi:hypothetical protein
VDIDSRYAHPFVFEGRLVRCVRPQPQTIKALFDWCAKNDGANRILHRQDYRNHMRALVQRMRQKRKIERDLGISATEERTERLIKFIVDCEKEIENLHPTPTVMAAAILYSVTQHALGMESIYDAKSGAIHIADEMLRLLRPHVIAGSVSDAVAEFMDNPDRPIAYMSFATYADNFKMPEDWPPAWAREAAE